jgi:hypothetical protein
MDDDDRPQPYLMPSVPAYAFVELRELMKEEEEFPRSYGEWQALWEDRRKEVESEGYKAVFVTVLPEAFGKYCKARKLPASWATLGQYITAKAGR